MKSILIIIIALAFLSCGADIPAQGSPADVYDSSEIRFRLETLLEGVSNPWSIALLPPRGSSSGGSDSVSGGSYAAPTEAFVTLRSGTLLYLSNIPSPRERSSEGSRNRGEARSQEVRGLPSSIYAIGQGGLLDIILAEGYRSNRGGNNRVYLSASVRNARGQSGTAVFTAVFNESAVALEQVQEIFALERFSASGFHFGSRLVIGPGSDLYISIGDRGVPERSQDRADSAGSIVRIPLGANGLPNGDASVYSYGHRNIQGMLYDRARNQLIAHEHGPRGGDEINLINEGENYGWPRVSYGINYNGTKVSDYTSLPGITEPLVYWDPSIAPSGFALYPETGVFAPRAGQGWSGQLFVGALAARHLRRVALPAGWESQGWPLNAVAEEEELLRREIGRIRDVRIDEAGYIYILSDETRGGVYRLVPE